MIDPAALHDLLHYERETGRLFWKARPASMFAREYFARRWNNRYAGVEALTATRYPGGYRCGHLFGQNVRAHRAVWALVTGSWPDRPIDHINGDPTDNRFQNLRLATVAENNRNRQSLPGTSSRFLGVSECKTKGRWRATISDNGRALHLGTFADEETAARAYDVAARRIHGDFANPNFPEAA